MLCRHLGAAGLYGNPQERKRPGTRQGGGGRGRDGALSRPRAPGGACPGLGAPKTAEAAPAPAPLSPPSFPRVTGRTVWERPRSTRIFDRGVREGRAASAAQKKTKSASCSPLFDRQQLYGEPWTPGSRLPLRTPSPKTSFRQPESREANEDRKANEKVSRFILLSPTWSPPPVFWVLPLPLGKGLIGFASKDCIYSVLLREARKHPGRQDSGILKTDTHTPLTPRGQREYPPAPHPWTRPRSWGLRPAGGGGGSRSPASLPSPGHARPWGWSLGQNVFYNRKQ